MAHLTLGYLTIDAPPAETVTAAAAAGFKSVGIRIAGRRLSDPYTPVLGNPAAVREIKRRMDDTGIRMSNLSAYHIWPDVTLDHQKQVMEVAAELRPDIIVCNSYQPEESKFVDLLARTAEMAAPLNIKIAVEFMRYCSVPTLQDTVRVTRATGMPNVGVLLDPLHLDRSGGTPADIAAVDPKSIVFVQLCDAMLLPGPADIAQLRNEARTGRLYPGDGQLPLYDYLDALPDDMEIECEVPRPDQAHLSLEERCRICADRFGSYLDTYVRARKRKARWE